jgi:hypothetical protein
MIMIPAPKIPAPILKLINYFIDLIKKFECPDRKYKGVLIL